jgi:hypothetical protein
LEAAKKDSFAFQQSKERTKSSSGFSPSALRFCKQVRGQEEVLDSQGRKKTRRRMIEEEAENLMLYRSVDQSFDGNI